MSKKSETTIQPTVESDLNITQQGPFTLQSGATLPEVTLHYTIYGKLNEQRDNAMLVCHALSGSARVADWWPQLFGASGVFDLATDCVICVNVIGSCYGSTSARSTNPATGEMYGVDFPLVSVRDWAKAQAVLLDALGIAKLVAVIGGSIGSMQAMQFAVDYPHRVANLVAIGAAPLTSLGLALNHVQRQAILNDVNWQDGRYPVDTPPHFGLSQARSLAMLTYKSEALFQERYARNPNRNGEDPHRELDGRYDISGYLDYQGEIFVRRFDAAAYVTITKAMDNFDLARGYSSETEALARITAKTLMVGISSDWLFPEAEVRALSERMEAAGVVVTYEMIASTHGHDAFLAESETLVPLIRRMLGRSAQPASTTSQSATLLQLGWCWD